MLQRAPEACHCLPILGFGGVESFKAVPRIRLNAFGNLCPMLGSSISGSYLVELALEKIWIFSCGFRYSPP